MAREDYWRIAETPVDGHPGPVVNRTYGGGYTFIVWLTARSDSPTSEWPDHEERYHELRQYETYAGKYALHEVGGARVSYTKNWGVPDSYSPLVSVRPPASETHDIGGWYLVEAVESESTMPAELGRLAFELVFVAPLTAYATHAEAVDALEANGI